MNGTLRCPKCGAELPPDAPRGQCPSCLMRHGLDDMGATASRGTAIRGVGSEPIRGLDEAIGRYTVLGEHARGGMGRVLVVHDAHLERDIALKELLPGLTDDSTPPLAVRAKEMVARFVREARVTGQLEHPSIAPVHELGHREDGTPYYTMKLIRGRTLAQAIQDAGTLEGRLRLLPHFVDLCQAVAYAHSRGVIHRDLKPQNVMIGEYGETVILDWGLAKLKQQDDPRAPEMVETLAALRGDQEGDPETAYGRALGTPAYMPAEQAWGRLDEIDERSDVYSLGAVLFELLTGQRPFLGATVAEVLRKVIAEAPPPIRSFARHAPAELIQICERAMRKSPSERFSTAEDLARSVAGYVPHPFHLNPFRPSLGELAPDLAALGPQEQRLLVSRARRRALRDWRFPVVGVGSLLLVLFFCLLGTAAPIWLMWTTELADRLAAEEQYSTTLEMRLRAAAPQQIGSLPKPEPSAILRLVSVLREHLRLLGLFFVGMSWFLFYVYLRFHAEWLRQSLLPHVRELLADRPGGPANAPVFGGSSERA